MLTSIRVNVSGFHSAHLLLSGSIRIRHLRVY